MSMALLLALLLQDFSGPIAQLAFDSVADREEAMDRLVAAGAAAVPSLERAARDADPEVAARAREALARIWVLEPFVDERGARRPESTVHAHRALRAAGLTASECEWSCCFAAGLLPAAFYSETDDNEEFKKVPEARPDYPERLRRNARMRIGVRR